MGDKMGVILSFPGQGRPRRDDKPDSNGASAEIVFFTGVRIERHAETDTLTGGPVRSGGPQPRPRRKA